MPRLFPATKRRMLILPVLLAPIFQLGVDSLSQPVLAAPAKKQLIWTLSNHSMNSDKLEFSGVPVQCFIGRGRAKGTFITRLHKDGPAYNSGIRAGDVILKINDRVIYNARIADSVIQTLGTETARVQIAKSYSNQLVVRQFNANWSNLVAVNPTGFNTSTHNSIDKSKKQSEKVSVQALEDYLFTLINADRKANGNLPPYKRSARLSALARAYAADQAKRNFTGHRDPEGRMPQDRARLAGINAPVAENVAFCEGDALTYAGKVKWSEDTMMAEPPNQMNHRAAILSTEYQSCGVGVGIAPNGRVNIAQEFSPVDIP
ncbi:MAG: PDZ domain-containing protein [Cyanobacteria bacterium HKST-UBA01]|nr:PDZ domain-containing protein [Cyanobacteria bacterium HKST-UBA01]